MVARMAAKNISVNVRDVDGIPTHVVETASVSSPEQSTTVLIVPGSPGIGHLYIPFANKLYEMCQRRVNISVVSHAGHSPGHFREDRTSGRTWYNLEDQIHHKLAYLNVQLPSSSPLILIGHSIGCYMILQMLKRIDPERVRKAFLLFPTIERMDESPSGRRLAPFLSRSWFKSLLLFLIFLCSLIPAPLKRLFLGIRFLSSPKKHQTHMIEGVMNIINVGSVHNIVSMGEEELDKVRELDSSAVETFGPKLFIYYGVSDHWVPSDACHQFKERFPLVYVEQCQQNHEHAFVLKNSDEMALHVHSLMKDYI